MSDGRTIEKAGWLPANGVLFAMKADETGQAKVTVQAVPDETFRDAWRGGIRN